MRIELEETALVRPSNAASVRGAGSAGSTTMDDSPLESSAEASARPTSPPPKMITSARSIARAPSAVRRNDAKNSLDRGLRVGILRAQLLGVGHGDRGDARAEARTGAGLAGRAARGRAALRRCAAAARCCSALSLAGAVALATHNPNDPSLSTAAGGPPTNWLGSSGAYVSDVAAAAVRPRLGPVPAGDRALPACG